MSRRWIAVSCFLAAFIALAARPGGAATPEAVPATGGKLTLVKEAIPYSVLGPLEPTPEGGGSSEPPRPGDGGMDPPISPKGCPPRCPHYMIDRAALEADRARGQVKLPQIGILVRPLAKDLSLERLALAITDKGDRTLVQTDDACGGCGTALPALEDPKAGYLFRLDEKANALLGKEYGKHPLELRIEGKGAFELYLVRLD